MNSLSHLKSSKEKLAEEEKDEFFDFLESLANSTYFNFQNIKSTSKTDEILQRLRIRPADYLRLIRNLTEDLTYRTGNYELKVRNVNNMEFIRATQILTEYGICYTTNSLLALNLSMSLLMDNKLPPSDPFFKKYYLHDVRFGNLFDGDMTYRLQKFSLLNLKVLISREFFSFIGFPSPITIYLHSPYEMMNIARSIGYTKEAYEFEAFSIEIITTKQFREDTFISQRGCRFHRESNLTHFKVYSKLLCQSECRLNLAMKRCGCVPYFYPNYSKY